MFKKALLKEIAAHTVMLGALGEAGMHTASLIAMWVCGVGFFSLTIVLGIRMHRGNQATVTRVSVAQSSFLATVNGIEQLSEATRARVAAAYRRALADPDTREAYRRAHARVIADGLLERTPKRGSKRAVVDACQELMTGADALLYAALGNAALRPADFARLTDPWVRSGLPLWCPRPGGLSSTVSV